MLEEDRGYGDDVHSQLVKAMHYRGNTVHIPWFMLDPSGEQYNSRAVPSRLNLSDPIVEREPLPQIARRTQAFTDDDEANLTP